jgi:hypothetical protein
MTRLHVSAKPLRSTRLAKELPASHTPLHLDSNESTKSNSDLIFYSHESIGI